MLNPFFSYPRLWSGQTLIFLGLVQLLVISEGHHFYSALHLPDATLAVFFLAGRYLKRWWSLPLLLSINFAIDLYVVHFRGVSSYCLTASYAGLIAAYGAMWCGGVLSRGAALVRVRGLCQIISSVAVVTAIAFVISNGSFYWLSGRYPEPYFAEYIQRAAQYFPGYMARPWFWLGVAAILEYCFYPLSGKAKRVEVTRSVHS